MYNGTVEKKRRRLAILKKAEKSGDKGSRLAWMEEAKTLPFAAVWEEYCTRNNVPGTAWIDEVKTYEKDVLSKRS